MGEIKIENDSFLDVWRQEMTKIFITGVAWEVGQFGGYEKQLGNVAILIPMIKMLKEHIPDAEISTTIQLTDKFCMTYGITRVPTPKRLLPRFDGAFKLLVSFTDLFRASLWRLLKNFLHLNLLILIKGNKLERFTNSDVILDFNGDIFPSDIHNHIRLLKHIVDILTIRKLRVPVIEFVSSPGPFNTWFTRSISKLMFNRISVFTNREPVSSELLKQIGIKKTPIVNTACPAFILEPAPVEQAQKILLQENVDVKVRPLVGITLCGYNLGHRTWGKPEELDSLSLYVPMLKFLLDDLQANVFLLPHVYRVNPYTIAGEHINGPDHDIALSLYGMVNRDKYNGRLRVIEGKYTSSEAKGIIGQCDMYISGRLHAGVGALSQAVPTVLLGYGHKHRGVARMLQQEKYVFEGTDSKELKSVVADAWKNREKVTRILKDRMIRIRELVNLNFEILKEIVHLNKSDRDSIPKEISDTWIKRGEPTMDDLK